MDNILTWLEAAHGGITGYLDHIGFDQSSRERLRTAMASGISPPRSARGELKSVETSGSAGREEP